MGLVISFAMSKHRIIVDDAKNALLQMEENSFDALLSDPPYHLTPRNSKGDVGFMNSAWDGGQVAFDQELWKLVFSRLKPGGSLLAFGGRRTFHRMMCAMEDAGFWCMDVLAWVFSQAKPVSVNISKEMDRRAGAEREVVGRYQPPGMRNEWKLKNAQDDRSVDIFSSSRNNLDVTIPATDEAKRWDGYGTSLKPCWEPIIWVVKPWEGSYVENALMHDVAGLNIDGIRLPTDEDLRGGSGGMFSHERDLKMYPGKGTYRPNRKGRWPGDLILDDVAGRMMDMQKNGASRFYYCAKVSRAEREAGVESLHEKELYWSSGDKYPGSFQSRGTKKSANNHHPTLKPLRLTTHLATMILPPERESPRRILVPFSGAGSEMIGSLLAGWDEVVGIENGGGEPSVADEYVRISEERISYWTSSSERSSELFDNLS